MKLLMQKQDNKLVPVFKSDVDNFCKIKDGIVNVNICIKNNRNLLHHRKFFAILRLIIDNSDKWNNEEELLKALKFELGYVEKVKGIKDNKIYILPKSISFSAMNQDDFEKFYDLCLPLLATEIGVSIEDLENNFGEYM